MQRLPASVLRKGQARGRIDPLFDAKMAASVLIGMVDGLKATTIRDPSLDRVGLIELRRTLIARFLAPPVPYAAANRYPPQQ